MTAVARPGSAVHLVSRSAAQTRGLAAALARVARAGDRIGLHGPLGAGKTQVAKGFAAGLGVADVVISPTFTLLAEYTGRLPLFHVDLYRLEGDTAAEAWTAGLLDERERHGVTLIEWAERLGPALDPERLELTLADETLTGAPADAPDEARAITLEARGARYDRYLAAARAWAAADARR